MEKHSIEVVNSIIERFDFEKVHAYMKLTDWKWNGKLPTIQDLKNTATSLLYMAQAEISKDKKTYSGGTGGFNVYSFEYGMKLAFEIEKKSNY
jgi:hypothetical protein